MLCCGYTLTDFPISIRLTSLALWQSSDCPSASKATLMNMNKYFMWIHYERLHNHNKAKHNKTVCIFLGIYCTLSQDTCIMCDAISSNASVGHIGVTAWVSPAWPLIGGTWINLSSNMHFTIFEAFHCSSCKLLFLQWKTKANYPSYIAHKTNDSKIVTWKRDCVTYSR